MKPWRQMPAAAKRRVIGRLRRLQSKAARLAKLESDMARDFRAARRQPDWAQKARGRAVRERNDADALAAAVKLLDAFGFF